MFNKTVRSSFALLALLAVSACGNSHDAAAPVAGTGSVQPETVAEAAAPSMGHRAQIVDAETFSAMTFAAPELSAARAELMLVTHVVHTGNTVELRTDSESIAIFDMANGGVVMSHRGPLAGAVAHVDMNGEAVAFVSIDMAAGEEHMATKFAVAADDDQAGQGQGQNQDQNQAQAQEQSQQQEQKQDEVKDEEKKEEAKPEDKKEESKTEDKKEDKSEVKDEGKTEGKTEGKAEEKKEEAKPEEKKEESKTEDKKEDKSEVKDEGKTEGKTEGKAEEKKEDSKAETKTEDKKEDTKADVKDEGKEQGKKEEAKK